MPPARSARAVPGPDRGDDRPGERAGVADLLEQPLGAVGRRDADQVERARVGQVDRRAARCGSPAPRRPSRRARAAAPASALACARARVTTTLRPLQRAVLEPAELVAQRGDLADERDRRRADRRLGGPVGQRLERRDERALARGACRARRSPAGSSARRPCGDELLGDPRQLADAHVEDERPGEARERLPVDRGLRLGGILVAGDERHRARRAAERHRDAGVGGRGDARGHAGDDLERRCRPRAARCPPRRRARRRTGRRP